MHTDTRVKKKIKVHIYLYISLYENLLKTGIFIAEFLKTHLKMGQNIRTETWNLVTAVRKNIGGLLSWLVSLSSLVPELTRQGLERGLHVNP